MQPVVHVNVNPMSRPGTSPTCAANRSLLGSQRGCSANLSQSPILRQSPNSTLHSPNQSGGCTFNCSCPRHGAREPVYGDASTFYNNSLDVRRNRKFM